MPRGRPGRPQPSDDRAERESRRPAPAGPAPPSAPGPRRSRRAPARSSASECPRSQSRRQAKNARGRNSPPARLRSLRPRVEPPGGEMNLRAAQAPIKDRYREDPDEARITLTATASETDTPVACSVEAGQVIHAAQAHTGVGGPGTAACSGDLLLGALAACAQVTCQMVAASMGIATERIEITVEVDLDLRGTLGVSREAPVGFDQIRVRFEIDAPGATPEQVADLTAKSERYCTVLQTLREPPPIAT